MVLTGGTPPYPVQGLTDSRASYQIRLLFLCLPGAPYFQKLELCN